MALRHATIWLVVGDSGSGKTTFCQDAVAAARQLGLKVSGLLCPARFEGGQKVGIDALDLSSGEGRLLGWRSELKEQPGFHPRLSRSENGCLTLAQSNGGIGSSSKQPLAIYC